MKTMFLKSVLSCIFSLLLTGCGLSIYEDWKASGGKAITGGGAIAGKDYVNGLLPSENSRKYFAKLSSANNQPIETVSRTDDNTSKSGVRFVKNGGIVIPPGVTISFTNKGYCMDPHLPAPKAGEEFQLVPVTQLIPEDLQGTYKKLVQKASAGDESVKRNIQHLVWALRTAGTDAAYANNLTAEQKRILNRCSEYSGQFEEFNATAKANSQMIKELLAVADSYLNVKIGGVTYKASDLLDPDIGNKKINEHLNQLITMSKSLPVERSGFNYGELQPGIYTDVRGSGFLQYTAKIANSTNKEFIFYPTDYAGQVGSGTKSQGLTFFATANTSQRQRVTTGNPHKVNYYDCSPNMGEMMKDYGKGILKDYGIALGDLAISQFFPKNINLNPKGPAIMGKAGKYTKGLIAAWTIGSTAGQVVGGIISGDMTSAYQVVQEANPFWYGVGYYAGEAIANAQIGISNFWNSLFK